MAATTKARYYVRVDTYWVNSPDYWVGPFDSREAAQAEIDSTSEKEGYCLSSSVSQNISSDVRVYDFVYTATESKRRGMHDDYTDRHNLIGTTLPNNSGDIFYILQEIRAY